MSERDPDGLRQKMKFDCPLCFFLPHMEYFSRDFRQNHAYAEEIYRIPSCDNGQLTYFTAVSTQTSVQMLKDAGKKSRTIKFFRGAGKCGALKSSE